MKKLIVILSIFLLPYLVFADVPETAKFIGEFPAGFRVYEFNIESYTVQVIYGGGNLRTGIIIHILSSPGNPVIPSGYIFLYQDEHGSGPDSFVAWRINGIIIYFVPTTENGCRVWVI